MRKRIFGRKLKRTTNQRKALFRSLTQALVLHGRIKTTEAKAKSVRGEIEKLITNAKNNKENALHYLQRHVPLKTAEGIIAIAPVFAARPGGYTRIVRVGSRRKDNASMVILEFVEKTSVIGEANKEVTKLSLVKKSDAKEAVVNVKAKTKEAKKVTGKKSIKK